MSLPKEVITVRVPKPVKESLMEKASESMTPFSSYVSHILEGHTLDKKHYISPNFQARKDFSHILSAYLTQFGGENTEQAGQALLHEDYPLGYSLTGTQNSRFALPLLPITRVSTDRFVLSKTKPNDGEPLTVIYYSESDLHLLNTITNQLPYSLKPEGFASTSDALARFQRLENSLLICGPILFSYLQSSSEPRYQLPVNIPQLLSTHYIEAPLSILNEELMSQSLTLWEQALEWFVSMLNDPKAEKSLKEWITLNLKESLKLDEPVSEGMIALFRKTALEHNHWFHNKTDAMHFFNGELKLKEAIFTSVVNTL